MCEEEKPVEQTEEEARAEGYRGPWPKPPPPPPTDGRDD